jgi:23S rRNA U2552 (ribose-2'-O)-methylase RlmE/FtsJ
MAGLVISNAAPNMSKANERDGIRSMLGVERLIQFGA